MRNRGRCLTVGITGGIGSGKTTVCAMLESFGRTVISADHEARALMNRSPSLKRRIVATFGSDAYRADGTLDRKFLAERAFSDVRRIQQLNAIVHPAVIRELRQKVRRLPRRQRCPYVLVEAALVFESGLNASLDLVVVIDAPREVRLQRVTLRDGSSRTEVLRRMKAQLSATTLRERADIVLMNRHDTPTLRSRVAFLDALLIGISSSWISARF